jgi:hypothetical protein
MGDAKFHRSLLCCAYEMNRYCFKVTSINFEFIMKYLEVKPFDFIIIAEMSIKYFGLLLNWNLVKRIKELEERMLESEIWKTIHPLYSQMDQESELCERNTDYQPSPRKALTHVTSRDSFFKGGSTEDDDEDIKDYGAVSMRTSVTDLEVRKILFHSINYRSVGIP